MTWLHFWSFPRNRAIPRYATRGRGLLCFSTTACLFFCLFVSLSARSRENGWTDLHEIFRESMECPRDDLIQFRVNSGKWVGGSKANLLSPDIAIWFDCCLLAVLCCHLVTENVMKLLFWPKCIKRNKQLPAHSVSIEIIAAARSFRERARLSCF